MDLREPTEQLPKLQKPRGIYLLPNLFTTAALFAAFYAIIAAVKGLFDVAAVAIFIAMIADTLDGRVARMTNTQTAFGAEYDSLSDMVGFGVAPALIAYTWSLSNLGKLGWLAAFLYTAATALRLARFNTQAHDQDKQYFQGLPCPSAAAVIAGAVWMGYANQVDGNNLLVAIPLAVLIILIAGLMVSTIRFHSFKKIDLKGKIPFIMVIIVVLIISTIALDPPEILFSGFFLFAMSGPVITLWQLRKMRKAGKRFKQQN
jgi:CDP-diacylglycerol---serine O-phosphatidyltransferase